MVKIFSDFSGTKTLFEKLFKSALKKGVQEPIQNATKSLANKPATLVTESPINLNNSNFAPYNKAMINFKGPFARIGKTAEDVPRNEHYYKYFESGYPLLGKYVHQGQYTVVKYSGKEIERYITTQGCGPCSKLTMYDPVNKVGFLAHVDAGMYLLNTKEVIKKRLLEKGAELKNLEVRHFAGMHEMPEYNKHAVRKLMTEFGLSEKQLIEENTIGGIHKDGAILDLKNGQTYELDGPYCHYYSEPCKKIFIEKRTKPKMKLSNEEITKMNEEIDKMRNSFGNYDKAESPRNNDFTEVK